MTHKTQTLTGSWSQFSALLAGLFLLAWPMTGRADALNYWIQQASGTTNRLSDLVYTNGLFVAVGGGGTIVTSPDGIVWTSRTSGTTNDLGGLTYGAGIFVAVGSADTVAYSTDAIHWTTLSTGLGVQERTADYNSVCFGQGQFVAVANDVFGVNHVVSSVDGIHWTLAHATPDEPLFQTYYNWSRIVYGNGRFVVMGNGEYYGDQLSGPSATLFSSTDATTWVERPQGELINSSANGLAYGLGQFVVGFNNLFPPGSSYWKTSTDGENWAYTAGPPFPNSFGITAGAGAGRDPKGNDVLAVVPMYDTIYTGRNVGTTNAAWLAHPAPGVYYSNGAPDGHNAIAYGPNPAGIGTFVAIAGTNILSCVVYPGPYFWTNSLGGNWSDPTNWSPNQVPDVGDDVVIAVPGTYTVNLDTAVARNINSLTLGAGVDGGTQTLAFSGGVLTPNVLVVTNGGALNAGKNSTVTGTITIAAGGGLLLGQNSVLDGVVTVAAGGVLTSDSTYLNGNITVAAGGELHTVNGTPYLGANGSLTIQPSGRLELDAYLFIYGPITNAGTIDLNAGNWIYIYNNGHPDTQGSIVNLPSGTINLNGGGGLNGIDGNELILNQGVIAKTTTGNNNTITAPRLDLASGTITNTGGALYINGFSGTLTGTYGCGAGGQIQFSGGTVTEPLVAGTPLVLGGPGSYVFLGAALLLPDDIIPGLTLQSGVLELGTNFQGGAITNLSFVSMTLTNSFPVTGNLTVGHNGNLFGDLTVAAGGVLTSDSTYLNGNITVAAGGELHTVNGTPYLGANGSLTIQPSGRLELDAYLFIYGPITNAGTIDLNASNWIYIYNNGHPDNRGTIVNLPSGTINLNGGGGLNGIDGNELILNQGVIAKTTTGNNNTITAPRLDLASGTITNAGGALYINGFAGTLTGTYGCGAGGQIQFAGGTVDQPLVAGTPLVLGGPGSYVFLGAALLLPEDIVPGLILQSGVLELGTNFQGGAITNLSFVSMTLTNSFPVTGNLTVGANAKLFGDLTVAAGGVLTSDSTYLNGNITVAAGGELRTVNGAPYLGANGSLTIQPSGRLDLDAYLYIYGPITNAGTIDLNASNWIYIYNNGHPDMQGAIVNLPAGTINLNGGGGLNGIDGNETLLNQGTIAKTTTGNNNTITVPRLDLASGIVTNAGGVLYINGFSGTLTGTYGCGAGGQIQFSGGTVDQPLIAGTPLVLGGPGSYAFLGAALLLPQDIVPGLILQSGVLELGPGFQGGAITNLSFVSMTLTNSLPVTGNLTVGANAKLFGDLTVAAGGVLTSDSTYLNGNITVAAGGELHTVNGTPYLGANGSLTIQPSGRLELDAYLFIYGPITNAGTIDLNASNWIYIYNNGHPDTQGAIVNLPAGTINLNGGGGLNGIDGSETLLNQGTIAKTSLGNNTITVPQFINSGTVLSQHGQLNLSPVTLLPSGSLVSGLSSARDYGTFSIAGSATLAGSFGVVLNGGYVPAYNATFQVLYYESETGAFASLNLPSTVRWQAPDYGAGVMTLGVPPAQLVARLAAHGGLVFSGVNPPGTTAVILGSDDFLLPLDKWTPLATITFDSTGQFTYTNSVSGTQPQLYFTIQYQ